MYYFLLTFINCKTQTSLPSITPEVSIFYIFNWMKLYHGPGCQAIAFSYTLTAAHLINNKIEVK